MKILFVCRGNIGRSQMAEAFFAKMSKKNSATSAGTHSREEGVEGVKLGIGRWDTPDAMKEIGFDVSDKVSKQLTPEMINSADRVIVIMTDEESKRLLPDYAKNSGKVELWEIEDGRYKSRGYTFQMRNVVKKHVEELVREIG